tara:strand:+ start:33 stop:326 length:294 start_codon:yes stop_codon:yes gene_type:complete
MQKTTTLDIPMVGEHLISYIINGDGSALSHVEMLDVDDYLEDVKRLVTERINPYYEGYTLHGLTFSVSDQTSFSKCEISGMWNTCHEIKVHGIISRK